MIKSPKAFILTSLLISSLFFASTSLAVESTRSAIGTQKKCQATTQRIDKRIEQYNKTRESHLMKYTQMSEHFIALADRLDKKGYDTTKLRTDGKTLDQKIKKASDDYTLFISKLEATKQYACGTSEGQFKTALEAARAQLKVFHSDVQDIRSFFKTTIKADLQALKDQKVKESPNP